MAHALKACPVELVEALKLNATINNIPAVGSEDNFCFPHVQFIVVAAQRADDCELFIFSQAE